VVTNVLLFGLVFAYDILDFFVIFVCIEEYDIFTLSDFVIVTLFYAIFLRYFLSYIRIGNF
jgi:hypothetical protein